MSLSSRAKQSNLTLPAVLAAVGIVIIFLAMRSRSALPEGARLVDVNVELHAAFLDAGVQSMRVAGEPVEVGPAPAEGGVVPVRIWHATALVRFERDAGGALKTLGIIPLSRDPTSDGWAVWRHRHGYGFVNGRGYFWNTLSDDRVPMSDDRGKMYDAFLKSVWSYWTIIGIESQRLKGPAASVPAQPSMSKTMSIAVSDTGLAKTAAVDFQINPWRLPVRVRFEVNPSTTAVGALGPFRWHYDMNEWRRRHGYSKGLFTGYDWIEGFPESFDLNDATGRALDELLERTMALWSEAAVQQIASDLEVKLSQAVAAPRL